MRRNITAAAEREFDPDREPEEDWVNPGDAKIPAEGSIIAPFGWRIVVMPMKQPAKIGSIIIPDDAKSAREWLNYVGVLIALGPGAYGHEKYARMGMTRDVLPKYGDWVLYAPYQPYRMKFNDMKLIALNDEDIIGVVPKGVSPWSFTVDG